MTNEVNEPYVVPPLANPMSRRFAVAVATWNKQVTEPLLQGALQTLGRAGVPPQNIILMRVPGSIELVNAAALAIRTNPALAAVIVLGCVIRGETPHFDYVCQSVTQGVTILNAQGKVPVIFGLVTTENLQQALDRAGGRLGNKGVEAAGAAISMAMLHRAY